ncbi:MAG: LacI family DNA-binding transcriptional regulator [Synergistaceae bacterium]|jgi:LacI family transcriptional regulator|nr:LacI family DNA-binding transcriptional regulator [Synergistaceae bacterium]
MAKRATLRDVAIKAGVSAVTVHKVLYDKEGVGAETRKKILAIAQNMDYSVNEAASSLKRKALHVAVVLQSMSNPQNFFFRKMWDGIGIAEQKLNDYRVQVTRLECGDEWESQERILYDIARHRDEDGVILHCWDETRLNAVIDYLSERGVPVVTVNSDAIGSKRVAFVSAPNGRIGRLAAEMMGRLLSSGGRVLVAGGHEMAENARDNRCGFQSYLKMCRPKISLTELYNFGDQEEFLARLVSSIKNLPDVSGLYAITARDTYSVCTAIRDLGMSGRIKVIGSDAFAELSPFFDDDTLHASIWKDPESQAEQAMILLYQYLSNRPMSVGRIKTGIIMKNNLEDYL